MPTPRTRKLSTASAWPQLSILTIYSSTPILDEPSPSKKLSDEELEAAKILYFYAPAGRDGDQAETMTPERRRRLLGTVMGVADFAKMMTKSGKDNKIRSVKSSRRRMFWIEPEDGILIHATIALPRHASSRRHGREASTATTSSSRSVPSDSTAVLLDDQVLISSLSLAYQSYRLQRGGISRKLEREGKEGTMKSLNEFWQGWVQRWDLSNSANAVQQVLGGFPMSPLLTPSTLAQLGPLLSQLSASNPSISPILLHATHVLHLPPNTSFLDSRTLESLVQHLISLQALRLQALQSLSEPQELASTTQILDQSSNPANWTTSALSYLDPRNVPLPSFPSAATTSSFLTNPFSAASPLPTANQDLRKDFAQLRKQSRRLRTDSSGSVDSTSATGTLRSKKEGSSRLPGDGREGGAEEKQVESGAGGWGLRSVSKSWSRLGAAFSGASTSGSDAPAVPPLPSIETETTTEPETSSSAQEISNDSTDQPDSLKLKPNGDGAETPGTPTVELAPEVNEEDLVEAMKGIELEQDAKTIEDGDAGEAIETKLEEIRTKKIQEEDRVLRLFGGEEDEPFEVRLIERGSLLLALASLPTDLDSASIDLEFLTSRSSRLLEAVETILEAANPPTSTSALPSYTIKAEELLYGSMSPSMATRPSADSESSKEIELETTCAMLEANRALNSSPQILESLTRLPTSSNWLSLTRSFHIFPDSPASSTLATSSTGNLESEKTIDVLSVLPAKNSRGRETTLVEAAEGARRIERKWVAQRCGP
ncbi:uncharacterized protein JCM6883_001160 [Sporobolomyces salmoneus]|uniref:uncharacterized protein n=1 Tax=Sporobolomyces salmoneus TaxID=183962 RepID=UPI003174997A